MAPSPDDIKQLQHSVWYETGTLVSQGLLYLREGAALAADADRLYPTADALFDSLLTKLRTLDGFFQNFSSKPTDAVASDLAPQWPATPILTPDERKKISVRIAHLTYLRPIDHEWDIGVMIRKAMETMRDFIQAAGAANVYAGQYRLDEIGSVLAEWGDLDQVKTKNDNHAYR